MKIIASVRSFLNPVRFLLAAILCTTVFFGSVFPAQAAHAMKSNPTEGGAQMNQVLDESEDAASSDPMSLKEVEKRSNEGINEVQGDADKNSMYRSNDSRPAIVDDFEKAMDKVTKK